MRQNIAKYMSLHTHVLFLTSWENASLFLLENRQNIKFGGVVRCESYLHFEFLFYVFI